MSKIALQELIAMYGARPRPILSSAQIQHTVRRQRRGERGRFTSGYEYPFANPVPPRSALGIRLHHFVTCKQKTEACPR